MNKVKSSRRGFTVYENYITDEGSGFRPLIVDAQSFGSICDITLTFQVMY